MTISKRLFDLTLAIVVGLLLWPVALIVAAGIFVLDGRPILFPSERMLAPGRPFTLWKFRTMHGGVNDGRASGGDKSGQVTSFGRLLRRTRLDELPQLWNILRGDMSFVGPRPPLRRYVEMFPELYARVLGARPGLTGLATLVYHRREEELLASCETATETEAIYIAHCVPAKAKLDIAYQKRRTICSDAALLATTVARIFRRR